MKKSRPWAAASVPDSPQTSLCYFGTKCPKAPLRLPSSHKIAVSGGLYKSVWIVEVVIVEDVLVLFCERLVRHGHFVHLTFLVRGPAACGGQSACRGQRRFHFIGLRRKAIIGVLFQIVFWNRTAAAPELQNAPISGHGGKLAGGHQLPAQPLGVLAVTFGLSTRSPIGLHGDRGLAQPVLRYFLDGAGLTATEE